MYKNYYGYYVEMFLFKNDVTQKLVTYIRHHVNNENAEIINIIPIFFVITSLNIKRDI